MYKENIKSNLSFPRKYVLTSLQVRLENVSLYDVVTVVDVVKATAKGTGLILFNCLT